VFYIHNGVRRALAAREAGQRTVGALILRPGKLPVLRRVALDRLFSPKKRVEADARFQLIRPPIRIPIEVEPLGERGQSRSVPLAEVKLA
jgi:hypothetical protein